MSKRFFDDIPIFEWDDLDGKSLLIRVTDDGTIKVLYGYDPIDDTMYVLSEKVLSKIQK